METCRTPDERFSNLPDYPFSSNYIETLEGYETLRIHYVDEGPADAKNTFLCLHGQPAWSYLYRKMIPVFVGAGHRVIAPDLIGFGKSDKPVEDAVYTFDFHRGMLKRFVEALDLKNITLVCQDWGGILGLTLPPDMSDRFNRLLVMNTAMPIGESLGEGFDMWKAFNRSQQDMDVGELFQRAVSGISEAEAAAYDAPFPDVRYKAGVRRFPELVMIEPGMDGIQTMKATRDWWANEWTGQTFMAVGMQDPVLGPPVMREMQAIIHGCPEPMIIEEAGHFVQEHGIGVAQAALRAFDLD